MMGSATWQRVKALYHSAADLPDAQREGFLQRAAAADPRAASEALRLIRADRAPASHRVDPIRLPGLPLSNPANETRLHPGQLLAGRYLVRRFLAAGGMGEVYEAEDRERAERIALKIFRREFAAPAHLPWLRREMEMARRVRHPNVCRVFDLVTDGELVFLTMEFLDGETLAAHLRREGALPERRAFPLVRQLVAGLAAAHEQGVVHRDFKPGNVMIVPRPDGPPRAVITDFGMARPASDPQRNSVTASTTLGFGTPAYMSPEQVKGEPASHAADVYALGVVLHEMLTGELPFADESPLVLAVRKTWERPNSPRRYTPGLRASWEHAILRCLEPDPSRRFSNVGELLEQLNTRQSHSQLRWRLVLRTLRRRLPTAGWAAAITLPLVTLLLWWAWPRTPSAGVLKQWEAGLFALHAGEPAGALRQWESIGASALPRRAPVDRALAWHALGLTARASAELKQAPRSEAAYAQAAAAWIAGDRPRAAQLALARAQQADASALADAAALGNPNLWPRVAALQPNHAGALLQLGETAARNQRWSEAERHYTAAATYFQGLGLNDLARSISARRGLHRLAAGDAAGAQADLQPGLVPTQAGAGPCERFVVLTAGVDDAFGGGEDPVPALSSRFLPDPAAVAQRLFDQGLVDGRLNLSFPLPNYRFCSGEIKMRIRRNLQQQGSINDTITIGAAPFDSMTMTPLVQALWARLEGTAMAEVVVDLKPEVLAGVQRAYAGAPIAYLDVMAGDDTDFDFLQLTLVY